MGLDCSHDAFSGGYSSFNRLRQAVAHVIGGSFPPHWETNDDGTLKKVKGRVVYKDSLDEKMIYFADDWNKDDHPGILEFLMHSDCDGEISPAMCAVVANELEQLILPKVKDLNWQCGGHIKRDGGYVAVLEKFIKGCRLAHANNENLDFH